MKFCCGITLYYPSKEELKNIKKYKEVFEQVYLFDNTDSKQRLENEKYFVETDGIIYISKNKNEGLSVAFNIMCKEALSNDFDYICLFDQDSIILNDELRKIVKFISCDNTKNDIAIYAPEIILNHKNDVVYRKKEETYGVEVEWTISSGSFINLMIYKETEGFDENYFIDRLDYDYCVTVKRLGYKILKINNVFLYQELGVQGKSFFKQVSEHSPIRHYYMFRNRLYYYLTKNKVFRSYFIVFITSTKHLLKILFLEKNKYKKIKMIIRGFRDYKLKKMGKYGIN